MIRKFNPQIPVAILENETGLTLKNDFFEVKHDSNAGGCPVSILFKNGSGENFLQKPVFSHIALKKDEQIIFYRQSTSKAEFFSYTTEKDGVKIVAEGSLADDNGNTIPVRFKQTFFYQAWGRINISLTLQIQEQLDQVYEIGVCGFHVTDNADTLGVRPGCPPPPPDDFLMEPESNLRWFELTRKRSYTQQYNAAFRMMPSYFCLFHKGVEGFEFWREDCGTQWDRPFGLRPGSGVFLDDSKRLTGGKYIRIEPFNSWENPRSFQPGEATFNYTLGLPFIKPFEEAREAIYHIAITSRDWPESREQMKKLADAGITLLRLHDDNTFRHPSWRDCYYPPYDEDTMKQMDQVIEWAHEFGIRIVPYFSLKEFHPDCPEYPEYSHKWKRWVHSDGRIIAEKGPYGGYMCMKSGWLEFLKSTIQRVLKNHKFDGVYYDHLWFRYCRHPEHANGQWHNDADEILDFLFWSRQFVGETGIVYLHTSACPTMIGENLSDLLVIGEDMPYASPLPDTVFPDLDFVPITRRTWVPAGAHWTNNFRQCAMIAALKHCPPAPHNIPDFLLELSAMFKDYKINDLHFHSRIVLPGCVTEEENVHVNIYHDDERIVLFCANLAKKDMTITLRLPLDVIDGRRFAEPEATPAVKIKSHSLTFEEVILECQADNAGMIQLKILK